MNHRFRRVAFWIIGLGALANQDVFAADCGKCAMHVQTLRELHEQKRKSVELLGKNNQYLAILTAEQASKFLKVKSNITVILRKIEQINEGIAAAEKSITDEGCISCEKGTS